MATRRDRVIEIVSQIMSVPIEHLDENSSPDTVENWDSLKYMNLILALEEKFSVSFVEEEVLDIFSVKNIVEILKNKEQAENLLSQ